MAAVEILREWEVTVLFLNIRKERRKIRTTIKLNKMDAYLSFV